jgi:thiosulfate/3-mercaptopyruvate sulfurtransferase
MQRRLAIGTLMTLLYALPASAQDASAAGALVSTGWLQQHLTDPKIRIIATGNRERFERGHIPGARFVEHDDTLDMRGGKHQIHSPEMLAQVLSKAGVVDGARLVLYGDSPMTTGWLYTAIAMVGHAADVSMLDGSLELWRSEGRPVSSAPTPPDTGRLTVRSAADHAVDAAWVRSHLKSPGVKLLDVRTMNEWNNGRLPGATLVLWQDLFADQRTLKWKSPSELRALLASAGVEPGQEIVTYCAVGMRASLMAWAARSVGVPAHVYIGSWQDWSQEATNPVVR